MVMSSEPTDPLASISEGATKGVLDWGSVKIKELVQKFNDRDLAFIEDYETIEVIKKQRKTGEWDLFKRYVSNPDWRILFQMGLALKRLEMEGEDWEHLTKKISKRYELNGLHVAYYFANGLFGKHVTILLERGYSTEKVIKELNVFFMNIDKGVAFITKTDTVKIRSNEIITKIHSNNPEIFIMSSGHSIAMKKCEQIKNVVMGEISNYECEEFNAPYRQMYFIMRAID
jgi:hypothetical protein